MKELFWKKTLKFSYCKKIYTKVELRQGDTNHRKLNLELILLEKKIIESEQE